MMIYDPATYRSPQRLWDSEKQQWSDKWMTTSNFDVFLCDGTHIHIPIGFEYDKASVPRMVWWYLPRDDKHVVVAALVHDYLYETKLTTRAVADRAFYDLLRQSGMRWSKAQMAYRAVRLGGWLPWARNTP